MPAEVQAQEVALLGEFNEWNPESHVMKQLKDGSFSLSVSLPAGQDYRFRYLLDGARWENDWEADDYVVNEHGGKDSLVKLSE
ncbi:MAG: isoamylase early set domain-containing protein [Anaerolineales bacterium]|nr:isoamylase early set domain-containing protein [Anaerolineales bacterium]